MIISGERSISYPEIHARIAERRRDCGRSGCSGGTPVAMMLRNDFALFEVAGAAAALGSPVVPINWHLKAEEVAYILADSGARILVCHADLLPQIAAACPAICGCWWSTTPPEIAAAFGVADCAGAGPRRRDGLGRLARRHAPALEPPVARRADVLYFRHHRPAEGRAPQADAARAGRRIASASAASPMASSRARIRSS